MTGCIFALHGLIQMALDILWHKNVIPNIPVDDWYFHQLIKYFLDVLSQCK